MPEGQGAQLGDPEVFVSYSWTSQDHAAWVRGLAERLEDNGVHVHFDQWDLREGQDKYAFMERMVTNPNISKVLMICDKRYADRADGREGGVGTETQIISSEIYNKVDQTKFIPIVAERDEEGNPYLPTFAKSRIYVDLSNPETFEAEYEKLLRLIYNKSVYERPSRGKRPSYLDDDREPLRTGRRLPAFKSAVLAGKPIAPGLLTDYLDSFLDAFTAEWIIEPSQDEPWDEQVMRSIERFFPYRDEFIELVLFLGQNSESERDYETLHHALERMVNSVHNAPDGKLYGDERGDNLQFLVWEIFLYTVAALLQRNRFDQVALLMEHPYLLSRSSIGRTSPYDYGILHGSVQTLNTYRPQRLGRRYLNSSLAAQLLKERAKRQDVTFNMLIEADFILDLRSKIKPVGQFGWHPELFLSDLRLLEYGGMEVFPIFARAQARRFFARFKIVLGVTGKKELVDLLESKDDQVRTW